MQHSYSIVSFTSYISSHFLSFSLSFLPLLHSSLLSMLSVPHPFPSLLFLFQAYQDVEQDVSQGPVCRNHWEKPSAEAKLSDKPSALCGETVRGEPSPHRREELPVSSRKQWKVYDSTLEVRDAKTCPFPCPSISHQPSQRKGHQKEWGRNTAELTISFPCCVPWATTKGEKSMK